MFVKWADHVITAVRYEYYGPNYMWKRIAEVEVREHLNNYLTTLKMWTRQEVVDAINRNHESFVTATESTDKWHKGAYVDTVLVNQTWYIRTDSNNTPADNLGSLPELQPIYR